VINYILDTPGGFPTTKAIVYGSMDDNRIQHADG